MGAISRPSNCSRGDAVHLWEATYVRKCLGSGGARGPDMHSEVSGPGKKKKKTCEMSPDWWCSLTQALLYNFSCGTRRRPLTLSQSVSFAPSPVSFLLPFYQFFFFNLIFFPLYRPPPPPPSHPSPDSHIHLLSSQHILACYCFSLRFGRPVFTNGLPPADQCFRYSCTNYRRSKMESSRAE